MAARAEAKGSHLRCKQEAERSFGNDMRLLKPMKSAPRDTPSNKVTPQIALSTGEHSVGDHHIQSTIPCEEESQQFSMTFRYKKMTKILNMCLS